MQGENETINGESANSLSVPRPEINPPNHGGPAHSKSDFDSLTSTVVRQTTQHFSGPLPHPEILRGYDNVHPGAANRIVTMAEVEGAHRREMESLIVHSGIAGKKSQFSEARRGQICAALIAVTALISGAYVALNGHDVAGSAIGLTGVGSIVTAFLVTRQTVSSTEQPKPVSKKAAKRKRNS